MLTIFLLELSIAFYNNLDTDSNKHASEKQNELFDV